MILKSTKDQHFHYLCFNCRVEQEERMWGRVTHTQPFKARSSEAGMAYCESHLMAPIHLPSFQLMFLKQ